MSHGPDKGWICLHRKMLANPLVQKSQYWHLWTVILLMATHKATKFNWNGQRISLKPGQLLVGRKKLNEITGIPESTIEYILRYLESEHQIGQQKTNKYRIITVENWEKYQSRENVEHQIGHQLNNNLTYTTTNNNVNNKKKSPQLLIFNHWNTYRGRSTDKLNKEGKPIKAVWRGHVLQADGGVSAEVAEAIDRALKKHTVEQVTAAIDNYAMVYLGADFFWSHGWTLSEFLTRGEEPHKDAPRKWVRFLPGQFNAERYMSDAGRRRKKAKSGGPTPYEIARQAAKGEQDVKLQTA